MNKYAKITFGDGTVGEAIIIKATSSVQQREGITFTSRGICSGAQFENGALGKSGRLCFATLESDTAKLSEVEIPPAAADAVRELIQRSLIQNVRVEITVTLTVPASSPAV